MASIIREDERNFQEAPNKIDGFQILVDTAIAGKNINPKNLNFDLRQLAPGQYSAPYHFHRHAEELFMIISGSATLRTPQGFIVVKKGDLIFFEMGERGAHQLYNHASSPCTYLDIRTFIGYDICEYPDSDKVFLVPSYEIFDKDSKVDYFKGESNVADKWEVLKNKK